VPEGFSFKIPAKPSLKADDDGLCDIFELVAPQGIF
jgi:hypothetical protein